MLAIDMWSTICKYILQASDVIIGGIGLTVDKKLFYASYAYKSIKI